MVGKSSNPNRSAVGVFYCAILPLVLLSFEFANNQEQRHLGFRDTDRLGIGSESGKRSIVLPNLNSKLYLARPEAFLPNAEENTEKSAYFAVAMVMMQCGMRFRNGKLVEGDFEACLQMLRDDLNSGRFKL